MPELVFLTLAEAVEIHRDQINRYGGHAGIRDMGLLESAIAMPEAGFGGKLLHRDIFEMAAAYAFYICQNHPFTDGNKRVALACALVFLELNGISLVDPDGLFYPAILDMASGKLDKNRLADILRNCPRE